MIHGDVIVVAFTELAQESTPRIRVLIVRTGLLIGGRLYRYPTLMNFSRRAKIGSLLGFLLFRWGAILFALVPHKGCLTTGLNVSRLTAILQASDSSFVDSDALHISNSSESSASVDANAAK